MLVFQILFIIFIFLVLSGIYTRVRAKELSGRGAIFWSIFWVLVGLSVLIPDMITLVANRIGIGRGTDLVTYTALTTLFFLVFRLYIKIGMIERSITDVVRASAIAEYEKTLQLAGSDFDESSDGVKVTIDL
jgi:small membrane protein